MKEIWQRRLKWLAPLLLLLVVGLSVYLMGAFREEPALKEAADPLPVVRTFLLADNPQAVIIESFGSVRPRTRTELNSRVSGYVEWVSGIFAEGHTVAAGEALVRLDSLSYQSAHAEAMARLELSRLNLAQEEALAQQARRDWEQVGNSAEPEALVLRQPQLARARAEQRAAEAALALAADQLKHTTIRAPYDGKVLYKGVDVGQAIAALSTPLGAIMGIDYYEVPLPLSLHEFALLNRDDPATSAIWLHAEIAGEMHTWRAQYDRSAAQLDQANRLIHVMVEVPYPFLSSSGMELIPGMFVQAEISAPPIQGALLVPHTALQNQQSVYIVDEDQRLRRVMVEILQRQQSAVLVRGDLKAGDRLITTPLLTYIEGMRVDPVPDDSSPHNAP